MKLPELSKRTSATIMLAPEWGLDGTDLIVAIIKQRFSIGTRGRVGRMDGARVNLVDDPWDPEKPEKGARVPGDLCARKPSTDILVAGEAVARRQEPVSQLDVGIRVGDVQVALVVFGERAYYKEALGGMALSAPRPFERVQLRWDLAFGGADFENPKRPAHEPRNPVGRGVVSDARALDGMPAPQIEDPADLIRTDRSRPRPVGVGPIGPHFAPRAGFAGTMDDAWQKQRMPLRPLDFDERFNQVAPPALVSPRPLRGGEPFALLNVNPDGLLQGELPRVEFSVWALHDSGKREHRPMLDTVVFEPEGEAGPHVDLTWRIALPSPPRRPLRGVLVYEKEILT